MAVSCSKATLNNRFGFRTWVVLYFAMVMTLSIFDVDARAMNPPKTRIRYVFLFDTSESMIFPANEVASPLERGKKVSLFEQIKLEAQDLVNMVPVDTRLTVHVMPFDRGIQGEQTFELNATNRSQSLAQIKGYISGLKATGQQTYIYSSLKKVIRRFKQEDTQSDDIRTTIWILTDGVDTGGEFPQSLKGVIELFEDYKATSTNKPWIYCYRTVTKGLSQNQKDQLEQEKELVTPVANFEIVNTYIDRRPPLRLISFRIGEVDFGYWEKAMPPVRARITFDFTNPPAPNESNPPEILFEVIPHFDRAGADIPNHEDVLLSIIGFSKTLPRNGSDFFELNMAIEPFYEGELNRAITGYLEFRSSNRPFYFKPQKVPFTLYLGERPAVSITPLKPTGLDKSYHRLELPDEETIYFKISSQGEIDGNLNSIEVIFNSEDYENPIQGGAPRIYITDANGFGRNDWESLEDWGKAEYAKVVLPYAGTMEKEELKGEFIFRSKGGFSILDDENRPVRERQYPFQLILFGRTLTLSQKGKPISARSGLPKSEWPHETQDPTPTSMAEPLTEFEIGSNVRGTYPLQIGLRAEKDQDGVLFDRSNFTLAINEEEQDSWELMRSFVPGKSIRVAIFPKKAEGTKPPPGTYSGFVTVAGKPDISTARELTWTIRVPPPPPPWWLQALKIIAFVLLVVAILVAARWLTLQGFKTTRLDLFLQRGRGNFDSSELESFHLRGKKPVVIGAAGEGLREFAAEIQFRPGKKNGTPVLYAKSLTGTVKLYAPDSYQTGHELTERGELNPDEEIRVFDQNVIAFGEYAFRINGIAYQDEEAFL